MAKQLCSAPASGVVEAGSEDTPDSVYVLQACAGAYVGMV
ncbi:hypothetical protein NUBL21985_54220 [Klebsiella pneumoniae]|nr:hypothetical protein NUBL21985_54220 [Klebsiella pneumoniae]GMW29151.1 hypothetical protein LOCUS_52050 [Klebsiella pneumoniae]GMW34193.1 hypothetical protein LOCUS_50840 [Klebsiella pneumoniae]GMX25145.1 hypothetical protein LOCUS_55900 [Klebsiella pneumoniae]